MLKVERPTTYYVHLMEAWDKKTCERKAKHREVNAFGCKHPVPGLIASFYSPYFVYGRHEYNGGCIRNGEWYRGDERPLPLVHPDYEIVEYASWGWRIQRKKDRS